MTTTQPIDPARQWLAVRESAVPCAAEIHTTPRWADDCESAASSESRRLFSLDVLRGVAIALVLFRHMMPDRHGASEVIGPVVEYFRVIGWCGVDLFFVLSGFLVSTLIFEEYRRTGRFELRRFWLRRGFRIWPAYYIGFGVMVLGQASRAALQGESGRIGTLLKDAFWNAVFVQNYVRCERWPHSWSLAIEEHFYLGLPLLLIGLWRFNHQFDATSRARFRGLGVVAVLLFLFVLWRRCEACFPNLNWHAAYYRTHMRIDALLAGAVFGHLYTFRRSSIEQCRGWIFVSAAAAGTVLCGVVPAIWPLTRSPWCASAGFTLLWVGFGAMVMMAAKYPQAGAKGPRLVTVPCKMIAWLGIYSYTIYIGHSIMFGIPGVARTLDVLQSFLAAAGWPAIMKLYVDRVYYLAGSIGLGLVLAHAVERPFLRLRSRLVPSEREVAPA